MDLVPGPGLNLALLHWKLGVLATDCQGSSKRDFFKVQTLAATLRPTESEPLGPACPEPLDVWPSDPCYTPRSPFEASERGEATAPPIWVGQQMKCPMLTDQTPYLGRGALLIGEHFFSVNNKSTKSRDRYAKYKRKQVISGQPFSST